MTDCLGGRPGPLFLAAAAYPPLRPPGLGLPEFPLPTRHPLQRMRATKGQPPLARGQPKRRPLAQFLPREAEWMAEARVGRAAEACPPPCHASSWRWVPRPPCPRLRVPVPLQRPGEPGEGEG
eukprot:3706919-Amphidinium_carterae.1